MSDQEKDIRSKYVNTRGLRIGTLMSALKVLNEPERLGSAPENEIIFFTTFGVVRSSPTDAPRPEKAKAAMDQLLDAIEAEVEDALSETDEPQVLGSGAYIRVPNAVITPYATNPNIPAKWSAGDLILFVDAIQGVAVGSSRTDQS